MLFSLICAFILVPMLYTVVFSSVYVEFLTKMFVGFVCCLLDKEEYMCKCRFFHFTESIASLSKLNRVMMTK